MGPVFKVVCGSGVQSYEGFLPCLRPEKANLGSMPVWAEYLGLVWLDGEPESWWMAGRSGPVEELQRYYRAEHQRREVQVHLFRPVG